MPMSSSLLSKPHLTRVHSLDGNPSTPPMAASLRSSKIPLLLNCSSGRLRDRLLIFFVVCRDPSKKRSVRIYRAVSASKQSSDL